MLRVVLVVWIFCKHARTAKENGSRPFQKTSTFCSYFIKCNNFIRKRTESHFLARGFEPHFRSQFTVKIRKKIANFGIIWLCSAPQFDSGLFFSVCFLCFVKFSTCSRRPLACSRFGCYHSLKKNNIAWIVFVLFFFSVYSPLCLSLARSQSSSSLSTLLLWRRFLSYCFFFLMSLAFVLFILALSAVAFFFLFRFVSVVFYFTSAASSIVVCFCTITCSWF